MFYYSARAVSSGHTNSLAFAFRPCHPSANTPSSLTFSMNQHPPLNIKQCRHTHLTCQASQGAVSPRDDELHVHVPSEKTAVSPRVGIIMGSDSDLPIMKSAAEILDMFDVPYEIRLVSAHRTPKMMYSYASSARDRGIQVIIAGAGGAAALPGMVAAQTLLPVIGVPVRARFLSGIDSLLSMIQMPKGSPFAIVAIDNATSAGSLAVRMLDVIDLLSRMRQSEKDQKEIVPPENKLEKHVAPRVGIIMGSDSDLPVMKSAAEILEMFGVPHEVRVVSAHDTPEMIFSYASSAHDRGIKFIIAGAGGSVDLPGMVATLTPSPVIGVPLIASSPNELDSLLSIVEKMEGSPVAIGSAIDNATNAGLLAVRLFGIVDNNISSRMSQYEEDQAEIVVRKGDKLEKHGWESYLNST